MLELICSLFLVTVIIVVVTGADIREEPCICTLEYAPVCGTDGVTYPNRCTACCAKRKNKKLEIAYNGECDCGWVDEPEYCIALYDPVCGSDGKTYGNACEYGIAYRKNPCLGPSTKGPCKPTPPPPPPPPPPKDKCICTREFAPVCGTDLVTYPNQCEACCAGARGIAYFEECDCRDPNEGQFCPKIYQPVCGSDGVTYANDCERRIAAKKNACLYATPGACR